MSRNFDLSTRFTGIDFPNPFMLASAPPTDSQSKIRNAFDAGYGGVVTKTIGIEGAKNIAEGPKTLFMRSAEGQPPIIRPGKSRDGALHSTWNWDSYSDKPLDDWIKWLPGVKSDYPNNVLIGSVMAGSGSDDELRKWQQLALAIQEAGCDGVELNLSCPHMADERMGSGLGQDDAQVSFVTQVVREAVGPDFPIWAKITPESANVVAEARAALNGGANAISAFNTFKASSLLDPTTLQFNAQVDGRSSTGGQGGPAILPLSVGKIMDLSRELPDSAGICGIGGISSAEDAINYFALGCGVTQICSAAMAERPKVVLDRLVSRMEELMESYQAMGIHSFDELIGYAKKGNVGADEIRRRGDLEPL